ncbi:subtilisin-like protease SBT4.3 [Chenopodium quinoa]|uniref:subtilisin-like protease SBT4.3 n=1 Tax=Chenopodium quinoa TaxID=63459 RepID=UPI000B76F493|nr:subtilisin-like protease SBT4.3 [Chenopodium quinoa]
MVKFMYSQIQLFILLLGLFAAGILSLKANDDRKVYIVYMGSISEEHVVTSEYHIDILQQVLEGSTAEESLVRSYKRSFNGFAARLTEKESKNLNSKKEVVSVFPSKTLQLQTTRSWDFLGLVESDVIPRNLTTESNVILGAFDTGVWPESPSFSDDGFGPPPKKWKGACKGGNDFKCNNKVIGASTTFDSARDDNGHGSHTASTAAGRHVDHANFYGLAEGIARGAVPSARIAVYKVCGGESCSDSDILTAFDEAIADGVDLITISIGSTNAISLYEDSIAIGAYHAAQKGILTVNSAGNSGNTSSSVASVAPWLFSVAAASSDRRIRDKVVLGNGKTLLGYSINPLKSEKGLFPLVFGVGSSQCSKESIRNCSSGCLDEEFVKGKIVVCDNSYDSVIDEALRAGALGVLSRVAIEFAQFYPLPAIRLEPNEFEELLSYLNSTKNPKANILKSFSFNDTSAPYVIYFSSRGPNIIASDILKPDITAPGVEIIAAFSPLASLSSLDDTGGNEMSANFSILSGTSMSCPHVAGASVYLKSLHPDWSPSAIKSALMTTACPMSPSKNQDAEFAYGSGHLDPVKAANPGLVYETLEDEYLTFFCKLGLSKDQIALITGNKSFSCPENSTRNQSSLPNDVNYPSLSAMVDVGTPFNVKFSRTVTNVGVANSTYTVKVESPKEVMVTVKPSTLSFTSLNEKKSFDVTVVGKGLSKGPSSIISASLVWSDGQHSVRSPIVIYSNSFAL